MMPPPAPPGPSRAAGCCRPAPPGRKRMGHAPRQGSGPTPRPPRPGSRAPARRRRRTPGTPAAQSGTAAPGAGHTVRGSAAGARRAGRAPRR